MSTHDIFSRRNHKNIILFLVEKEAFISVLKVSYLNPVNGHNLVSFQEKKEQLLFWHILIHEQLWPIMSSKHEREKIINVNMSDQEQDITDIFTALQSSC